VTGPAYHCFPTPLSPPPVAPTEISLRMIWITCTGGFCCESGDQRRTNVEKQFCPLRN
jgi:hypothetical protein